jgi:ubiquinone/menaquinone biosynthesis C-methylase UbiE
MDWHRRYLQQARWTRDLRAYLFKKAGLDRASRVLEVGCGTGAVLSELPNHISIHGLDIDPNALNECRVHAPAAVLVRGDGVALPYPDRTFEIVYCHFLLLWVSDPLGALLEMKRVAKMGAHVIAFAEPDYTARVDEPRELVSLGRWQAESLKRQGADPGLGARLDDLFFEAGIRLVETGTMQDSGIESTPEEWELEWEVIESDLAGFVPAEDFHQMKKLDHKARARGARVLHVPTYFAWGVTDGNL